MLNFNSEAKIYLRTGATDMRKSINGLAGLVQTEMFLDPFSSAYFVFCNKTRHLIKLLYWDKTGFALWYKRLEEHKFPWPQKEEETRNITAEEITWLLSGVDFFKAHEKVKYTRL